MILLDANILLYAYVDELPQHARAARWLENQLFLQSESVALAWIAVNAFLRISTSKRIFEHPWTIADAAQRLDDLLAQSMIQIIGPTDNHWQVYRRILTEMRVSGDLVMDVHIAAIAIEHNASVASADKDFRRFSDYVKIIDPTAT